MKRERELLPPNWRRWMPDCGELPLACGNRESFPKSALSHGDAHVVMTYSRGFPSAITCMTADFLANVQALFTQPIEKVTLSDSRVVRDNHGWHTDYPGNFLDPKKIWFHRGHEIARDAFSHACVTYGRAAVGLPPLPIPQQLEKST